MQPLPPTFVVDEGPLEESSMDFEFESPKVVNRFNSGFDDLTLYQRGDNGPMGYFCDQHGVALTSLLEAVWDNLPANANDAGSEISRAIGAIEDEEEENEDQARTYGGMLAAQSNAKTLAALDRLRTRLLATRLDQLGVVRKMPKKVIDLTITMAGKYRQDPLVAARFEAEMVRQLKIQLRLLNGQTLDRWFIKLDLFDGPKEMVQWGNWVSRRPTNYLIALHAELLRRALEELDRTSPHGNARPRRVRLAMAIEKIRAVQSQDQIVSLLSSLDDEWARDLVGRSNSQTDWKKKHAAQIQRLFTQHVIKGDQWKGLADPENWKTLAPLHNPDQVAGGERHLPAHGEIDDFVGPGSVNSAIGRAWGLPETEYDEELDARVVVIPNRMQQLRSQMFAAYPPECWALFTTNFGFSVTLI